MNKQHKRSPLISIITRTKDRDLFLLRAVNSALAQTFDNFEMIIVNDGGDSSVVDRLIRISGSSKIRAIHNNEPLGRWKAANQGVRAAKGDYLVLLDDDDTWHPDFLVSAVEYLNSSGAKGVVTASDRIVEIIEDEKISVIKQEPFFRYNTLVSLYDIYEENVIPTNAFVYSRSVIDEIGIYEDTMEVLADWEFNLRFLKTYDIETIPKVLAFIHHREQTQISSHENSVIGGVHTHHNTRIKLLNRQLRLDLEQGTLGSGYLLNVAQKIRLINNNVNTLNKNTENKTLHLEKELNLIISHQHEVLEKTHEILKHVQKPFDARMRQYARKIPHRVKKRFKRIRQ